MKKAAGILALIGGALSAVGVFLTWAKVSIAGIPQIPGTSSSEHINGWSSNDGRISVALGVLGAVLGLLFIAGKAKRILGVVLIVAGLAVGGISIYDIGQAKKLAEGDFRSQIKAAAMQEASKSGTQLTADQEQQINQIIDTLIAGLKVSVGIGLYVVLAGGILLVIGGAGASLLADSEPASMQAASGGGWAPPPPVSTGTTPPSMMAPAAPPPMPLPSEPPPSGPPSPSGPAVT